jgi:tellurite resistance protein
VTAIEAAQLNETLTKAFSASEIEAAAMKQFQRAKSPMGRIQLKREIEQVASKDQETKELIFMVGVMVASADNNISQKEKDVLLTDAKILGLHNAAELIAA